MEQATDKTDALIPESSRIEEDCTLSAKGHFEAARRWSILHRWALGLPSTVIAAVAGVLAFNGALAWAAALAVLSAALTAILTFLNPSQRGESHLSAANEYNSLKNDSRMFKKIEAQLDGPVEAKLERLRNLSSRRDQLNKTSPQIPRFAFEKARKGIAEGESTYSTDRDR